MLKLGIKDEDRGWNDVLRSMDRLTRLGLRVGIFEDAVHDPRGTPITLIAAVNEFGSDAAKIPARPVFAKTYEENQDAYAERAKALVAAAVKRGRSSIRSELKSLGDEIAGDIQAAMHELMTPGNEDATIANKGFDNPWIHTEQTVNAVEARVVDKGLGLNKDKLGSVRMRDSRGRFA